MGARTSHRRYHEKGPPVRPVGEGIAEDAVYDARYQTWGSGPKENGKRSGAWVFHYTDGTLAGRAVYENGAFHGPAEWFHNSGDLREQVTYVEGKVHGKQLWQRTKKGKMPGLPWFDKLGPGVWRYEVARARGEGEARHFTFYGKDGVDAQVPSTADGRSVALGEHMFRLEPETVLMLVEECFVDDQDQEIHAGSLARLLRGAKTEKGRYVYVGQEMEDLYRLRFVYDDGSPPDEFFADPFELTRAFTLAADYYLTARALLDASVRAKKKA